MTKIQLLATLLALFIFAMLGACSNEDYPEPDVFKVTPDLRTRINTGIKMASRTEKRLFNETFNSFLHKCDEMGSENTPYQYMETEEYADLKKLILSSSPATCYLLMDRYLKRNPPFFSFILNDLIETAYPNTADKIANRMKSLTTVQETMELFPQVCLEIWLDEIESQFCWRCGAPLLHPERSAGRRFLPQQILDEEIVHFVHFKRTAEAVRLAW
mgnify:CR=1 FL=1